MGRRLIMVRHGQTTYNATRRMQGHIDTELSETGRAQARRAAGLLRGAGIKRILSSDLERAATTAEAIGEVLGLEVRRDARLRETHLGEWQGRTGAEVDAELPGARAHWRHDASWAPPGGESRLDVARRARPVIDEEMAAWPEWENAALLVVAHGGAISALTSDLLGFAVDQYPLLSGLGNGCWVQLTARPRYRPEAPAAGAAFTPETVGDAQWYLDGWNLGSTGAVEGNADMGEGSAR